MKKLLLSIVVVTAGCNLDADYVRADRATYDGMQPCIRAGIASVGTGSVKGRVWGLVNKSWDTRLAAAERQGE